MTSHRLGELVRPAILQQDAGCEMPHYCQIRHVAAYGNLACPRLTDRRRKPELSVEQREQREDFL